MKSVHDQIREHLLRGVLDTPVGDKKETLAELKEQEGCPEFHNLMICNMIVGRYRYGKICLGKPGGYNRLQEAHRRLDEFERTGNGEFLVDVANYCKTMYAIKDHPSYHFSPIDDGVHAEKLL